MLFLENDHSDNEFALQLSQMAIIPNILPELGSGYSQTVQFERGGGEMVGMTASVLKQLLICCGQITFDLDSNDIYPITDDKQSVLSFLMEQILKKDESDIVDYFSHHLEKAVNAEYVDMRAYTIEICSFIRLLLEVDEFLRQRLPAGSSLPWNIRDRLTSSSFITDVIVKQLEIEISSISQILINTTTNCLRVFRAFSFPSSEKVRLAGVDAKLLAVKRIRILLRLLSTSLSLIPESDAGRTALSEAVDTTLLQHFSAASSRADNTSASTSLTAKDFGDLLKEVSQREFLPRVKDFFLMEKGRADNTAPLYESVQTIHLYVVNH